MALLPPFYYVQLCLLPASMEMEFTNKQTQFFYFRTKVFYLRFGCLCTDYRHFSCCCCWIFSLFFCSLFTELNSNSSRPKIVDFYLRNVFQVFWLGNTCTWRRWINNICCVCLAWHSGVIKTSFCNEQFHVNGNQFYIVKNLLPLCFVCVCFAFRWSPRWCDVAIPSYTCDRSDERHLNPSAVPNVHSRAANWNWNKHTKMQMLI